MKNSKSNVNKLKTKYQAEISPADLAFTKIKEMIYNNELGPGQKLIYKDLSEKFNMSITPVIHALNKLQFLNIVYYKRNKGFYVGEANPDELIELFFAREMIEVPIMGLVIKNLTAKNISSIEKIMKEHKKALLSPHYRNILMFLDTKFHLEIIKCANNKIIYLISKWIFEQIYLKWRAEYMKEERIKEGAIEHKMLLQAIKDRDTKKATNLLKLNIRNGRKHIVNTVIKSKRLEL